MSLREETALKSMKYNRFILLRYSLALFFFANLNWFIFMMPNRSIAMVIPLFMFLFALIPANKFIKLYSKADNSKLTKIKPYFITQFILNIFLVAISFHDTVFSMLFPFLNANVYGKSGAMGILALGIMIAYACVKKIKAIDLNKDSGYKNLKHYKNSLKVSEAHGK